MIVILNIFIMFGMCYFIGKGIKATIHNGQVKKQVRIDAKREAREEARRRRQKPRQPQTVDRGYLIAHRIER